MENLFTFLIVYKKNYYAVKITNLDQI